MVGPKGDGAGTRGNERENAQLAGGGGLPLEQTHSDENQGGTN
jgi:hypothetical protein